MIRKDNLRYKNRVVFFEPQGMAEEEESEQKDYRNRSGNDK